MVRWLNLICGLSALAEMGKIEVFFEFNESRTIICCERSRISETVELQISHILGVDSPKVFFLTSNGRRSTTTPYYLLQRWVNKWKSFIKVDSLEQVKNEDRLSVVLVNKENEVRAYIIIHYECLFIYLPVFNLFINQQNRP